MGLRLRLVRVKLESKSSALSEQFDTSSSCKNEIQAGILGSELHFGRDSGDCGAWTDPGSDDPFWLFFGPPLPPSVIRFSSWRMRSATFYVVSGNGKEDRPQNVLNPSIALT